ncbi:ACT domain-containing protein [Rhodococcus kronopolitis]|uniref:ACT domain-containing protein n=1 Tax=Rhodococcus kronopolitis TaxID=1460226 RepID=A0ABV9FMI7_9NOCA
MTGERNIDVLLAAMDPVRREGTFVFVFVADPSGTDGVTAAATVAEEGGLSLVVTKREADIRGWTYDFEAGWITLQVHSALDAVGLTAAVSGRLADLGISCNVIAGYHHDHLLVPVGDVPRALDALRALAREHGDPSPRRHA